MNCSNKFSVYINCSSQNSTLSVSSSFMLQYVQGKRQELLGQQTDPLQVTNLTKHMKSTTRKRISVSIKQPIEFWLIKTRIQ
eukprot:m.309577 g.309577  ORF g.309577 m.309577 type:complete len:82 (+) comp46980_c0_seq1:1051-1296(+)